MAWGRLAAFAALAVFISVFSFSIFNGVGNYNFAAPYTHEATHGFLLMLVTRLSWCAGAAKSRARRRSCSDCAAGWRRCSNRSSCSRRDVGNRRPDGPPPAGPAARPAECGLMLAGVALPTLGCAAWLARGESWKAALVDSCQAWWLVLVNQRDPEPGEPPVFSGFDHPWLNAGMELQAAFHAVVVLATIWSAGWFVNGSWSRPLRWVAALAALAVVFSLQMTKNAGRCLPGLRPCLHCRGQAGARVAAKPTRESRTLMALALVLLAGAMLARMILRARIDHFGFFQAAFAAMAAAAAMVPKFPDGPAGPLGAASGGAGRHGRAGPGLCSFAAQSAIIRANQTQPVASGRDRFFALDPEVDERGCWSLGGGAPAVDSAAGTLVVLPEGVMINYLSRRPRPLPDMFTMKICISNSWAGAAGLRDFDRARLARTWHRQFGAPGNPGKKSCLAVGELHPGSHTSQRREERNAAAQENTSLTAGW